MRRLTTNNYGSVYPALIFIFVICLAAFVILIFNEIYTPFYQLMKSSDTDIDPAFDAPRSALSSFIDLVWPKGVMLGILIISGFALIMEYQKKRYQGG